MNNMVILSLLLAVSVVAIDALSILRLKRKVKQRNMETGLEGND
ncbi:MAG TPA: hypothetical protein VK974_09350 [Methylophilaceae bacterium]|nr:hypothetical protein [Methylophilaceae bacterium]